MTFNPYDDDVSIEGVEDGRVLVGIRGSKSWRDGTHTNEKNATRTIPVSPETARDLIQDTQDALDQIDKNAED